MVPNRATHHIYDDPFCKNITINLNTLLRAYSLMMNKITRSLMDMLNKIKRCKIWLKFWYLVLTFQRTSLKMFSGKWEQNLRILIKFYIFWFHSKCPSSFWLSYSSLLLIILLFLQKAPSQQAWIYFFEARTNCLVETMLRRTRWISDRTSDKTFSEKITTSRVCVALKTILSYCTLINIKLR